MSWNEPTKEDTTLYNVVVNHEEQHSIWPTHKETPAGWRNAGKSGNKAECLAYVKEVWTDLRPLSVRQKMDEFARNPAPEPPPAPVTATTSLVDRLSEGEHRVEAGFGSDRSLQFTKEAIDRGYVHITFTGTNGG